MRPFNVGADLDLELLISENVKFPSRKGRRGTIVFRPPSVPLHQIRQWCGHWVTLSIQDSCINKTKQNKKWGAGGGDLVSTMLGCVCSKVKEWVHFGLEVNEKMGVKFAVPFYMGRIH